MVLFPAGGIATPADAAMMMQLGADGVFVGSGIFKSGNPAQRAAAAMKATTFFDDPDEIAKGRFRNEAAFASLAGVAPLQASSGNTTRHRLNRHGDRQLNMALDVVIKSRMRFDDTTKKYVERPPPKD